MKDSEKERKKSSVCTFPFFKLSVCAYTYINTAFRFNCLSPYLKIHVLLRWKCSKCWYWFDWYLRQKKNCYLASRLCSPTFLIIHFSSASFVIFCYLLSHEFSFIFRSMGVSCSVLCVAAGTILHCKRQRAKIATRATDWSNTNVPKHAF